MGSLLFIRVIRVIRGENPRVAFGRESLVSADFLNLAVATCRDGGGAYGKALGNRGFDRIIEMMPLPSNW